MSACMSGTRGSGVLSSTGDVLVRGLDCSTISQITKAQYTSICISIHH